MQDAGGPDSTARADFLLTHLILFMTQGPFAVYLVLARGAVSHISPIVLVVVRFIGGTLALNLFHRIRSRRNMIRCYLELHPSMRRDLLISAILCVLSPLTFVFGLRYTTAVVAAAIDASCPVVAIAMALVLRTEQLRPAHAVCLTLSVIGNVCVLELWDQSVHPEHVKEKSAAAHLRALVGALLVFASVVLAVVNYSVQRPLVRVLGTADVITYVVTLGLGLVLLFALTDIGAFSVLVQKQSPLTWVMVGYAFVVQGWSHTLFTALALKRSTPVMLSMYTTLVPAISSGLAYLMLGEEVNMHQFIGIVLVVVSVVVAALANDPVAHQSDGREKKEPV